MLGVLLLGVLVRGVAAGSVSGIRAAVVVTGMRSSAEVGVANAAGPVRPKTSEPTTPRVIPRAKTARMRAARGHEKPDIRNGQG